MSAAVLDDDSLMRGIADHSLSAEQQQFLNLHEVEWQGKPIYAKKGEWVVGVDPKLPDRPPEGVSGIWLPEFAGPNDRASYIDEYLNKLDIGIRFEQFVGVRSAFLISAPFDIDSRRISELLSKLEGFRYVEPNAAAVYTNTTFPNDPSFSLLTGLNNTGQSGGTSDADIDAPEAWDYTRGFSGTVVGVIDTGVDWDHPDLAANIWINPGEIPGNGVDDDGNGYIDDVRGWDFIDNENNPDDANGHGTHVAGTIAAVGNNSTGVAGVAWNAKIMPLRAIGPGATQFDIAEAINYATMMRQRGTNLSVTNNSWGIN
jgi:subtilisin family serine protease